MREKLVHEIDYFGAKEIMDIVIVGPITTKSYFGGVATFDENLAIAFKSKGHRVLLLSSQKDLNVESINDIPVKKIHLLNAGRFEADIVIFSLGDIKYLNRFKAKFKIAFLHGFFNVNYYGLLKAIAGIGYQKFFFKYADVVIANSSFTQFMNKESAGIKTDGAVSLGVSYDFLEELKQKDKITREHNSILFTGRLVNVKGVAHILKAIKILKDEGLNYHLYIVGDGPEKNKLSAYNDENKLEATFVGKVSQKEIVEYYKKSEIFVSLNESEPYGITFCEALLSGCKIICPNTGGQVEFLSKYPNNVEIIRKRNPADIAEAIKKLSNNRDTDNVDVNDYTYEKTAKEILNIVERKKY